MSSQVYSVPIIYHGVRPAEALHQIFDSLDALDKVVEDVFTKITNRVHTKKSRLSKVNHRIAVAQAQIKQVTGTNRATSIFSPAKYPAPSSLIDQSALYSDLPDTKQPKHTAYLLADEPHAIYDNSTMIAADDILIHETSVVDIDASNEGLGRIPKHLPSLSGLLLFNSSENPYKTYLSLDNLQARERSLKKQEEEKKKQLADAPKTFTDSDILPAVGTIEYSYRPTLGEVPELNLPSVLPNLPNVADITWTSGLDLPSIAPSVPSLHSTELPSFDGPSPPPPTPAPATTSAAPAAPSGGPPPPPPPSNNAPPPPPPPTQRSAPPPPPPQDVDVPAPEEGRNSLLEDIRKGHMTRLKSSKERKDKKKKKEEVKAAAKSSGTGDIFGDLIQALNRRRAGIAEKQKETVEANEDSSDILAPPETADDEWK